MNKKKIWIFILITFGISWTIWLPNVLTHNFNVSWKHSDWLHLLGGLGPFLGAIITTFIFDGIQGIKEYFKNKLFSLPKTKWILIGVGMPILFFLIPFLFLGIFKGNWLDFSQLGLNSKLPFTNPLLIWLLWCFFYGVGEESGWRGLLLPEITKKYKARISTLYVAFIWASWHIPIFFYDKNFISMGLGGTIGWLVGLILGSLLLGWLVKQANWNLLPVILWHGTFNFFTTSDKIDYLYPAVMSTLVVIIALWIGFRYGKDLSKKTSKDKIMNTERIDKKILLSTIWIFVTLNYLYCDLMGLMDTDLLKQYLTGTVNGMKMNEYFLLGAAILMEVPIVMVLLSRILKYKANRWANILAGLIMSFVQTANYSQDLQRNITYSVVLSKLQLQFSLFGTL